MPDRRLERHRSSPRRAWRKTMGFSCFRGLVFAWVLCLSAAVPDVFAAGLPTTDLRGLLRTLRLCQPLPSGLGFVQLTDHETFRGKEFDVWRGGVNRLRVTVKVEPTAGRAACIEIYADGAQTDSWIPIVAGVMANAGRMEYLCENGRVRDVVWRNTDRLMAELCYDGVTMLRMVDEAAYGRVWGRCEPKPKHRPQRDATADISDEGTE